MKSSFEETGPYFYREGLAKERGLRNLCRKKLYLLTSDQDLLFTAMDEASRSNDCYEVKIFKEDRQGVYCGFCYFTNENSLGDAWARYESHPKIWTTIHDDELCDNFKDRIRNY